MKRLIIALCLLLFAMSSAQSQMRIAVLPFQNMDGAINLNVWSYKLQDSVSKLARELDPEEKLFRIVPSDSVEDILTQMNLDPTNPQYPSDMWKAVKLLNVNKVITGNFNTKNQRYLINAYIYDVRTKMANPTYQAKDKFKKEITQKIEEKEREKESIREAKFEDRFDPAKNKKNKTAISYSSEKPTYSISLLDTNP